MIGEQAEIKPINLSLGDIPGGPPEEIRRFTAALMLKPWKGYIDPGGLPKLKRRLTNRFEKLLQKTIQEQQVLITAGASMALTSVYHVIGKKGILIPNPGFPPYRETTKRLGIQTLMYPIGPDVSWDETLMVIEQGLNAGFGAVLWNNPGNPFGTVAPKSVVEHLSMLCTTYNAWCISDEVYRDFCFEEEIISPFIYIPERTLFIYSFSKSFAMAGMRIGCVIGPEDIIQEITRVHWSLGMSVSWIGQEIAVLVLDYIPDFPKQLSMKVSRRIKEICFRLKQEGIPYYQPQGGIFLCIDIRPTGLDANTFSQKAWEQIRVSVTPGYSFGDRANHFIRINTGVPDDLFQEAIDRLICFYHRESRESKE